MVNVDIVKRDIGSIEVNYIVTKSVRKVIMQVMCKKIKCIL